MPDGGIGPRMSRRVLADGRLHLSDGPIDLVIGAWGDPAAVRQAYRAAADCAAGVLDGLCAELEGLRAAQPGPVVQGAVGLRMQRAVASHVGFITPMAAVAGAVGEHVLAAMTGAADLQRAYVNNGGDIALHLAEGAAFSVGIVGTIAPAALVGTLRLVAGDGVCGIATSGWPGRSHSLGIADAVTVLAAGAAVADAAATVIANAVDLPGHTAVVRVPARSLRVDSDLGDLLVTRGVGALPAAEIGAALAAGAAVAGRLMAAGLIVAAYLYMQGQGVVVAPPRLYLGS